MSVSKPDGRIAELPRASIIAAAWLVALMLLAPGLTSPFDKEMDARSCTWVEDVAQAGHWLIPLDIYHRPCLKPPLFYWLGAIVIKVAGGRGDAPRCRIVSLAAAATLATVTMFWTAGWIGGFQGWLAFFILISTYAFSARATSALIDMLFSLLMLSAYYFVYPLVEGAVAPWRAFTAGLLLGLAILTKGPLAIVLCALAGLIYLLLRRGISLAAVVGWRWPWLMLATGCAMAAAWYVPALIAGQDRLAGIIMHENTGHFLPLSMGGTGEAARPIYYIVARLVGGSMPWCLLIVPTIIALASGAIGKEVRRPLLYQLAMLLAVVLFFSLASAKRDEYILPAMPALAIVAATAFMIDPAATGGGRVALRMRQIVLGSVAALMATFVILAFVTAHVGMPATMLYLKLQPSDLGYARLFADGMARRELPFLMLLGGSLLGVMIVTGGFWQALDEWTAVGVVLMVLAGVLIFNGVLRPRLACARSPVRFAAEVRKRIRDAPLYLTRGEDVPFSLYYGRPVLTLPATPPSGAFLLARPPELAALAPSQRARLRWVMNSDMIGGGGSPALYEIEPPGASGGFNPAHSKQQASGKGQ
jgi:4-amino-4-deoxy-L-arabinose transferase-like glycosyltransferase